LAFANKPEINRLNVIHISTVTCEFMDTLLGSAKKGLVILVDSDFPFDVKSPAEAQPVE
jgi:hypothetical protein